MTVRRCGTVSGALRPSTLFTCRSPSTTLDGFEVLCIPLFSSFFGTGTLKKLTIINATMEYELSKH